MAIRIACADCDSNIVITTVACSHDDSGMVVVVATTHAIGMEIVA